jgi:outer membrane receptor protein involved in Fe transport
MLMFYSRSVLTTFGETLPVNSLVTEEDFNKSSAYINFNHYVFDRLRFNLGGRVDYFDPLEKQFYFSPRLSASYTITDITSVSASGGIYYQSPAYLWLAVNGNRERLKNIRADQLYTRVLSI